VTTRNYMHALAGCNTITF